MSEDKAPEAVKGEVPVNGTSPRHLIAKLSQVLGKLERIPKNGFNQDQGYAFVRESDCADAIRRELAKVGVFIFSTVESYERTPAYVTQSGKQMFLFRIWVNFTFMEAEAGERWEVHFPGEALDFGDKGLYKAITGSMKYLLMKTFLLSSGDDPENDSHGEEPHGQKAPGAPTAQPKAETDKRQQRKPSAPVAESGKTEKGGAQERVVEGLVQQVAQLESKTGKPYVAVFIGQKRYSTFDKKLFPALLASSAKQILLRVQDVSRGGKKFAEIVEILPPSAGVPSPSTDITDGPWNDVPAA